MKQLEQNIYNLISGFSTHVKILCSTSFQIALNKIQEADSLQTIQEGI